MQVKTMALISIVIVACFVGACVICYLAGRRDGANTANVDLAERALEIDRINSELTIELNNGKKTIINLETELRASRKDVERITDELQLIKQRLSNFIGSFSEVGNAILGIDDTIRKIEIDAGAIRGVVDGIQKRSE